MEQRENQLAKLRDEFNELERKRVDLDTRVMNFIDTRRK